MDYQCEWFMNLHMMGHFKMNYVVPIYHWQICAHLLVVDRYNTIHFKYHLESCDSGVALWQSVGRPEQTDLMFSPATTCSMSTLNISSFPQGTVLRITTRTQKTTLAVDRHSEAKSTASHCTVPMGLVTDICKCSLTHAHTLTVQKKNRCTHKTLED